MKESARRNCIICSFYQIYCVGPAVPNSSKTEQTDWTDCQLYLLEAAVHLQGCIYIYVCVCVCVWAGQLRRYSWTVRDRIPVGTRFSAPFQTVPEAHPAFCKMGTGSFPAVKCSRGLVLFTHPLLVMQSWKIRAKHLPKFRATPGCNGFILY